MQSAFTPLFSNGRTRGKFDQRILSILVEYRVSTGFFWQGIERKTLTRRRNINRILLNSTAILMERNPRDHRLTSSHPSIHPWIYAPSLNFFRAVNAMDKLSLQKDRFEKFIDRSTTSYPLRRCRWNEWGIIKAIWLNWSALKLTLGSLVKGSMVFLLFFFPA